MKQKNTEENARKEKKKKKKTFLGEGRRENQRNINLMVHEGKESHVMYSQNEAILNDNSNQLK